MNLMEITVIAIATLAGPVLAVQAQKWIERATERRRTKLRVFSVLMATRATRLSAEHVEALNRIELEFRSNNAKENAVRDAWRLYADKLNDNVGDTDAALSAWAAERESLFTELMFQMSRCLGFDFDRVQIRRGVYYPRGHGELEERQRKILIGSERILGGEQAIPMKVTEIPTSPELVAAQVAMAERAAKAYSEDGAMKVRVVD